MADKSDKRNLLSSPITDMSHVPEKSKLPEITITIPQRETSNTEAVQISPPKPITSGIAPLKLETYQEFPKSPDVLPKTTDDKNNKNCNVTSQFRRSTINDGITRSQKWIETCRKQLALFIYNTYYFDNRTTSNDPSTENKEVDDIIKSSIEFMNEKEEITKEEKLNRRFVELVEFRNLFKYDRRGTPFQIKMLMDRFLKREYPLYSPASPVSMLTVMDQINTFNPKPAESKPFESKPVDPKPMEPRPMEPRPLDPVPVQNDDGENESDRSSGTENEYENEEEQPGKPETVQDAKPELNHPLRIDNRPMDALPIDPHPVASFELVSVKPESVEIDRPNKRKIDDITVKEEHGAEVTGNLVENTKRRRRRKKKQPVSLTVFRKGALFNQYMGKKKNKSQSIYYAKKLDINPVQRGVVCQTFEDIVANNTKVHTESCENCQYTMFGPKAKDAHTMVHVTGCADAYDTTVYYNSKIRCIFCGGAPELFPFPPMNHDSETVSNKVLFRNDFGIHAICRMCFESKILCQSGRTKDRDKVTCVGCKLKTEFVVLEFPKKELLQNTISSDK